MTVATALGRTVRATAVRASQTPAFDVLVAALERIGRWPRGSLAVLTYHRVDEPAERPDLAPSLLSASPAGFNAQMAYLAGAARPIGAQELLLALDEPRRLGDRAVLVTVDDAYADFAEHAWPSLRQHGVPVVLFVPTAFAGDPEAVFWWDRAHAALLQGIRAGLDGVTTTALGTVELSAGPTRSFERIAARLKAMPHEAMVAAVDELIATLSERLVVAFAPLPPARFRRAILDWDALRRLAAEGVALAPHGRTHALLDRVPPQVVADELAGSRRDLERETGSSLPLFAYPGGQHDSTAVRAVAAAGFVAAFTTQRGTNDLSKADPLRLRRINVGGRSGVSLLRAQLLPAAVRLSSARDR